MPDPARTLCHQPPPPISACRIGICAFRRSITDEHVAFENFLRRDSVHLNDSLTG
jgi:hypothetical protein